MIYWSAVRGQMWQPPCHHTPGILEDRQSSVSFTVSTGFPIPPPLLPTQQDATCCGCYMSSYHFQPTSPTPPRLPPCNCLQWSSDINVHKNLGYLLKMQILCLPTENPMQYCIKSGRAWEFSFWEEFWVFRDGILRKTAVEQGFWNVKMEAIISRACYNSDPHSLNCALVPRPCIAMKLPQGVLAAAPWTTLWVARTQRFLSYLGLKAKAPQPNTVLTLSLTVCGVESILPPPVR